MFLDYPMSESLLVSLCSCMENQVSVKFLLPHFSEHLFSDVKNSPLTCEHDQNPVFVLAGAGTVTGPLWGKPS